MIPAARARIGNDGMHFPAGDNEGPSHEVDLDSFLMDIEPVSVGAYVRFLNLVKPSRDQLYDWCILPEEDLWMPQIAGHVATPLSDLPIAAVNQQLGVSPFGLRGMAGNVWQWCRDTYHENFYLSSEASLRNAWNSEAGEAKSERGGSWVGPSDLARSSYRRGRTPEAKGRCLGFRCAVLTAEAKM
eukprot:Skav227927  [mRNA]  locus=scaffold146:284401:286153:+ [translate_table: standard]